MWERVVRPFVRALDDSGRRFLNYIGFFVGVLFCAIATILVDASMYLSAWVFGFLGATGLILFGVYILRDLRKARERKREIAAVERRTLTQRGGLNRVKAIVASVPKLAGRLKTGVAAASGRARFWRRKNRAE